MRKVYSTPKKESTSISGLAPPLPLFNLLHSVDNPLTPNPIACRGRMHRICHERHVHANRRIIITTIVATYKVVGGVKEFDSFLASSVAFHLTIHGCQGVVPVGTQDAIATSPRQDRVHHDSRSRSTIQYLSNDNITSTHNRFYCALILHVVSWVDSEVVVRLLSQHAWEASVTS